jgi:ribonuclease P protein component
MAVSVRKNWGGAVARNRVKRLVREAFRTRQFDFPAGYDYIFIINRGFNTRRSKDRKVDILPQSVTLSEIMARFDVILKQIKEQADLI